MSGNMSSTHSMDLASKPSSAGIDSIILEEEIDPNYIPSEEEVIEYAKWLGMDLEKDKDMFWIAREGLMAPLPKNWKPCKTKDTEDIYYFNFTTGESTWDHPCDGYYKRLYEEEKKKKELAIKDSNDEKKTKAKQDVEKLLGKVDKKKKRNTSPPKLDIPSVVESKQSLKSLEKKPLPGIFNVETPKVIEPVKESLQSKSKLSSRLQDAVESEIPSTKTPLPLRSKHQESKRSSISPKPKAENSTPIRSSLKSSSSSNSNPSNRSTPLDSSTDRVVLFNETSDNKRNVKRGKDEEIKSEEKPVDRDRNISSRIQESNLYVEEVNSLHKKLKDLRDERNKALEEKEIMEEEYNSLKIQNRRLEASLNNLKDDHDNNTKELDDKIKTIKRSEAILREKLEEAEDEVKMLRSSNHRLKDLNNSLTTEMESLSNRLIEETKVTTDKIKSVATANHSNDSLLEQIDSLKNQLQESRDENSLIQSENEELKEKIQQIEIQLEYYTHQCEDREGWIKAERAKVSQLESDMEAIREELIDEKTRNLGISKDDRSGLHQLQEKILISRTQIETLEAQLNTSERQIIQFQQDNRLLEDNLREQKSIVVRLQATIEKLQSSSFPKDKDPADTNFKENRIQSLETEILQLSDDISKRELQIKTLTQKLLLSAEDYSNLQEKFNTMALKLSTTIQEKDDLLKRYIEVMNTNETLTIQLSQFKSKISSLESQLTINEVTIHQLRESVSSPVRKDSLSISELQLKVNNLESQLTLSVEEVLHTQTESRNREINFHQNEQKSQILINDLQTKLTNEVEKADMLRKELRSLRVEVIEQEQSHASIISQHESNIRNLNLSLHNSQNEVIKLRKDVEVLEEVIKSKDNLIQELKQSIQVSLEDSKVITSYQHEVIHLQSKLNQLQSQNADLLSRIQDINDNNPSSNSSSNPNVIVTVDSIQLLKLESVIEDKENELKQLHQKYLSSMDQMSNLAREKTKYNEELRSRDSLIVTLQEKIKTTEEEYGQRESYLLDEKDLRSKELIRVKLENKNLHDEIKLLKEEMGKKMGEHVQTYSHEFEEDKHVKTAIDPLLTLVRDQKAVIERLESKLEDTGRILASLHTKQEKTQHHIKATMKIPSSLSSSSDNDGKEEKKPTSDDDNNNDDDDDSESHHVKRILQRYRFSSTSAIGSIPSSSSSLSWSQKLSKERTLLDRLRNIHKTQRQKLKDEQRNLQSLRNEWKSSKSLNRKITSKELNKMVTSLNKSIKNWKDFELWLSKRFEKLQRIEELMSTTHSSHENKTQTIEAYFHELDQDFRNLDEISNEESEISEIEFVSEVASPYTIPKLRSKSVSQQQRRVPSDYITLSSPPVVDDNHVFIKSLHVPKTISNKNLGSYYRHELRELTDNHWNRENAYEQHVNWLQSLKKELGSYSTLKENSQPWKKGFSVN